MLGQTNPSITTLTDHYTVPASTTVTVSSIVVCNRGAADLTFRISIAVAGAANDNKQYLYYDVTCPANNTFVATIGATLGAADVIRVYTSVATASFTSFGVEVTA